jgi:hypothetical protein
MSTTFTKILNISLFSTTDYNKYNVWLLSMTFQTKSICNLLQISNSFQTFNFWSQIFDAFLNTSCCHNFNLPKILFFFFESLSSNSNLKTMLLYFFKNWLLLFPKYISKHPIFLSTSQNTLYPFNLKSPKEVWILAFCTPRI